MVEATRLVAILLRLATFLNVTMKSVNAINSVSIQMSEMSYGKVFRANLLPNQSKILLGFW